MSKPSPPEALASKNLDILFADRRGHDRPGRDSRQPSDEEYDTADNASVVSSMSDGASINGEGKI